MPLARSRPGTAALLAALLAGALLVGCDPGSPVAPAPPAGPLPAAPKSDADLCGPKPFGAEQPPEAAVLFDVTEQQLKVIESRLVEVLCRQGLWRQGVGFGVHSNQERTKIQVIIHPGRSGLSAKQILDRLLGRGP